VATVDSDKSFVVTLKHDDNLDERSLACIQAALLYSTKTGERRIRVHTLALKTTSILGTIFKYADLDTVLNTVVKKASIQWLENKPSAAIEQLVNSCAGILTAYRKYCAKNSTEGQLILPESLKLLPLYSLSAIKSRLMTPTDTKYVAFLNNNQSDKRAYLFYFLLSQPIHVTTTLFYPRLFSLHNLRDNDGKRNKLGVVRLPSVIRLGYDSLESTGIYLMDTVLELYLWVGSGAPSQLVMALFGVEKLGDNTPTQLGVLDSDYNLRVHAIIEGIRFNRSIYQTVKIIAQGDPFEGHLSSYCSEEGLIRTENVWAMNYVDYLCHLHRKIQDAMW